MGSDHIQWVDSSAFQYHGHTSYLFICLLGVNMTIIGSKELSCKTNFCAGSQKRVDDDQRQVGALGKQIL